MSPRVFFLLFLPHEGVLHPVALVLEQQEVPVVGQPDVCSSGSSLTAR
jgi:hypothetical protein